MTNYNRLERLVIILGMGAEALLGLLLWLPFGWYVGTSDWAVQWAWRRWELRTRPLEREGGPLGARSQSIAEGWEGTP